MSVLLYIQTAYSIWVFVRDAKFFRLPYVLISSLWHKGICHSVLKKRKYIKFVHAGGLFTPDKSLGDVGFIKANKVGGRTVMKYRLHNGSTKLILCDDTNVDTIVSLYKLFHTHIFSSSEDLLIPKHYLIKEITFEEVVQKFLDGYTPILCEEYCWVDQTSSLKLNQNFNKMISIVPVYLQARRLDKISAYAFVCIICFDFFSYFPNLLWQFFKKALFKFSKSMFSKLSANVSEFMHQFFSTISEHFKYSDQSMKKAYYYRGNEVLVSDECLLPNYVTDIVEFNFPTIEKCNRDGSAHVIHFKINSHNHMWKYKLIHGYIHCKVFINNEFLVTLGDCEPDDFDVEMNRLKELERIGLYPAEYIDEGGIHVAKPDHIYELVWGWSHCKLIVRDGVYVF